MSGTKSNAVKAAMKVAKAGAAVTGASLGSMGAGATIIPATGTLMASVGFLLALTKIHDSLPINKKTAPVEPVSDTWRTRPKANMVKWMMKQSGVGLEKIAAYLGCQVNYLNTKLARDSFSFEDLIIVAFACGYTFVLANNSGEEEPAFRVDLIHHFENSEPEVLERINEIEEKAQLQAVRREEYEKKKAEIEQEYAKQKAELEKMREEYGLVD